MMDLLKTYNLFIDNKYSYIFTYIFVSIYIGYTLQPVPEWLNKLFNESNIFKFIVLLLFMSLSLHGKPNGITQEDLMIIIISSICILSLFEFFRKIDKNNKVLKN
jgi:hypothetical protein